MDYDLQPVDHQPQFSDVPGVGVVPADYDLQPAENVPTFKQAAHAVGKVIAPGWSDQPPSQRTAREHATDLHAHGGEIDPLGVIVGLGGGPGGASATMMAPGAARVAMSRVMPMPEIKIGGAAAKQAFRNSTGREIGTADTDLKTLGRGDVTLPPHMESMDDFHNEVMSKVDDVKKWNNPERRYWYENSGKAIDTASGGEPEMADRLTATVAKTSQSTSVLDNAGYAARGHSQVMAGDPVHTGRYPNVMGEKIQGYYDNPEVGVVGPKISGYQSGFRTAWNPEMLNEGANDIWNMRWLGYSKGSGQPRERIQNERGDWVANPADADYKGTPTTGQHNYDRMLRSAVTHHLNAEGFDGGGWEPGQVQAVGWAKQREISGVPAGEEDFNIANAFNARTAREHYESAPGKTTNHLPEYHNATPEVKQAYHDAINQHLIDAHGRDVIASHFGLLTQQTEHGLGAFEGGTNPGSAVRIVTGNPEGSRIGYDASTEELMKGAALVRGSLLQQDAVASHFPQFPKTGLTKNNANMMDVRTGSVMTPEEAHTIMGHMNDATGTTFFSPVFTKDGYRFINEPSVSGISNPVFHKAVETAVNKAYPDKNVDVVRGVTKNFYQDNDWSKGNDTSYLKGLRSLRPDVQRRASELLATLGPKVSAVQDQFAAKHGWTVNPATRIWETNPAYKTFDASKITPGAPPKPWTGSRADFQQDLLQPSP